MSAQELGVLPGCRCAERTNRMSPADGIRGFKNLPAVWDQFSFTLLNGILTGSCCRGRALERRPNRQARNEAIPL